jgi:hypothetical protein
MDTKSETHQVSPTITTERARISDLKPEVLEIGKVVDVTHGGGKIYEDGQKNQERQ